MIFKRTRHRIVVKLFDGLIRFLEWNRRFDDTQAELDQSDELIRDARSRRDRAALGIAP